VYARRPAAVGGLARMRESSLFVVRGAVLVIVFGSSFLDFSLAYMLFLPMADAVFPAMFV